MRELTSHKVNGVNDGLKAVVQDEPGHGGACHDYTIEWDGKKGGRQLYRILFQNGPIKEVGTNGLTHEVLLAILIDRLEGFQSGQYACETNQGALDYLRKAQEALLDRTRERLARGVEGTHQK
jgi:hypothetical protein